LYLTGITPPLSCMRYYCYSWQRLQFNAPNTGLPVPNIPNRLNMCEMLFSGILFLDKKLLIYVYCSVLHSRFNILGSLYVIKGRGLINSWFNIVLWRWSNLGFSSHKSTKFSTLIVLLGFQGVQIPPAYGCGFLVSSTSSSHFL